MTHPSLPAAALLLALFSTAAAARDATSPAVTVTVTATSTATTTTVGAPAAAPAPAASPSPYAPSYLPKEIVLTEQQLASVREATMKRVESVQQALVEQNLAHMAVQRNNAQDHRSVVDHARWARDHTKDVYKRHAIFSTVIFVTVLLLVFSGIALTWYQFAKESSFFEATVKRLLSKASTGTSSPEQLLAIADILRSEQVIELGKDGMKLRTRIVGLATLLVSMGFFYLYLQFVYPITVQRGTPDAIAGQRAPSAAASAPAAR